MNEICVRFSLSELDELVEALSLLEGTFSSDRLHDVFTRLRYARDHLAGGILFSVPFGSVLVERWFSWEEVNKLLIALSLLYCEGERRLEDISVSEFDDDVEYEVEVSSASLCKSISSDLHSYFKSLLDNDDNYIF